MAKHTSGFLRATLSLFHYVKFYEIRLSPRPRLLFLAVTGWCLLTFLSFYLSESDFLEPTLLWFIPLFLLAISFLIGLARSDSPSKPHYKMNESVLRRLQMIGPSEQEQSLGFERFAFRENFGGEVIISHRFNSEEMSNPKRDWKLRLSLSNAEAHSIYANLKPHRVDLVAHGRQAFLKAALGGKALINESKIAFATDFPNVKPYVDVFRTDYFTSRCSVDRSLQDVVVREAGEERVTTEGGQRLSKLLRDDWSTLPGLGIAAHSVSLHLGIEVIAVSSDGFLRIPIQSHATQYSQNMRAPLASGSVDWEDLTGCESLKDVLRRAAGRELAEEWGANVPDVQRRLLKSDVAPDFYPA